MGATERRVLLTCEHAGRRVPAAHRALFAGRERLLDSHRGWDPGALRAARALASRLGAELISATATRLLVDLNRSPTNPAVFSEVTRRLPADQRRRLLARFHEPHWDRVRASIEARPHATLHVAVHSFTPVYRGSRRPFRVGILYDPKRARERAVALAWQRRLRESLPRKDVRRNAPYRGDADGLTTALRREFGPERYLGLELELNQAALRPARGRRELLAVLADTLGAVAADVR